ncbi:MAG: S-layer homology domain-containing protein [Clostridia bacterium]|nr:S-layer homology domain-containing protein [Clostridia bacterium]
MKRKIALILTVVMLIMSIAPLIAFADSDKGLQNVIKSVKEKLSIPTKFTEFNYNIETISGKKIWNLAWNSKDENDGNVNVRVNESGVIYSYNFYKPYDYSVKKLPKVSKKEAKEKTEAFIEKLNPGILSKLKFIENPQQTINDTYYNFNYVRMANSIPFYNNGINVDVSRETGDIQNYNYNWTENAVFPSVDKAISIEKAQEAFKQKLGLKLVYNYYMEDEKMKVVPVYTSVYSNQSCIDALTGEKIDMTLGLYGTSYDMAMGGTGIRLTFNEAKKESAALSPEEIKAVEEVSKLISQEEAEKIVLGLKYIDISGLKLIRAELAKDWYTKKDFTWNLFYSNDPIKKSEDYKSVNIRLDAQTGEVKGFYSSINNIKETDTPKYDEKAAKIEVEKFLKEFFPKKFDSAKLEELPNNDLYPRYNSEVPKSYYFRYLRHANGVPFPSNSLGANFDAVNGKITSLDMEWFDVDFPGVDKVITLDSAYKKLFAEIGLELQYKTKNQDPYIEKFIPQETGEKEEIRLVYAVKPAKPVVFDANTGIILDQDGKPFKEKKAIEYTDIKGHYAEKQITALAEYGIAFESDTFKPKDKITQQDFFILLSKVINNPGYYIPYASKSDKTDEIYKLLIREGIVKESEKAPNALLTREDSVKFIIRALKYDKVADLKDIFICNFKDKDKINPALIGYVTIASSLKIINGNGKFFNPKGSLTRGDAAILIYNYLQK